MNYSSKILKLKSRSALLGNYFPSASIVISMLALSGILSWLLDLSGFSLAGDTLQKICYLVMSIIILLLEGLLEIGLSCFFLNMALGMPFAHKQLFYCFSHDPDRFILAAVIRRGLGLLLWLPALIYFRTFPGILEASPSQYVVLALLLLAALLFNLLIHLFLGQSYYILLEDPDCGIWESLQKSMELVRGRKAQFFLLHVSFFGYYLLELGTMGVGALWIQPYVEMTKIQFYLNLTGRDPQIEAPSQDSSADI